MDPRDELYTLRARIDQIDDALVSLFAQRMGLSEQIGIIKREAGMPVLDAARERRVIERAASQAPPSLRGGVASLMRTIMALSRERQEV